nr:unnamed protein product [Callosobruchus chinensis]
MISVDEICLCLDCSLVSQLFCDRRHEVYESKWFAFRRLAFLLDRDEPTQAINSIEGDKDDEEEIEETDISEVAGPEIDTLELQH